MAGKNFYHISKDAKELHYDYPDGKPPIITKIIYIKSRERIDNQEDIRRFTQLKINKQTDLLLETMKILEPRLLNVEYLPNGLHVDLQDMPKLLPVSSMGDGVRQLMSLVLAISDAQGGILLIDEIENGLHYSVITDVWKVLADAARRFDVQIFATTHSGEMIHAAHEAFKESDHYDFRYHRLDRRKDGAIVATTYDQDTMQTSFELELEVR